MQTQIPEQLTHALNKFMLAQHVCQTCCVMKRDPLIREISVAWEKRDKKLFEAPKNEVGDYLYEWGMKNGF